MTLEECINKKKIVQEFEEVEITHQKEKYRFKIGDEYNRLTIVKLVQYIEGEKTKRKGCICKCSCGNYTGPSRLVSLVNGELMSCGCYQRELHSKQMAERNYKHGCSIRNNREHLYILWGAMLDRTRNHNRKDSKYYSDKGIQVCDDWTDYLIFKEWSMNNGYEEGLSIDRIDNSLGYCPENCRWIPLKDQNKNKTSNRVITIGNETMILEDWCRKQNLNSKLVSSRLSRGWSIEKALDLI